MTLSSLFIVCSHGRRSAHKQWQCRHPNGEHEGENSRALCEQLSVGWCPGGRPATLEDLGGEKVWWCEEHDSFKRPDWRNSCWVSSVRVQDNDCRMSERILIPLPQMVAGEPL